MEEAKVAKWSKETNRTTRLQNKTLNAMSLVAVCVTEGVYREGILACLQTLRAWVDDEFGYWLYR